MVLLQEQAAMLWSFSENTTCQTILPKIATYNIDSQSLFQPVEMRVSDIIQQRELSLGSLSHHDANAEI